MNAPIVVRAELVELPKIGDMELTAETVVCFTAEEGGGHVILSQDALQAMYQRLDKQEQGIKKLIQICEQLNKRLDNHAEAIKLTKDLVLLTK